MRFSSLIATGLVVLVVAVVVAVALRGASDEPGVEEIVLEEDVPASSVGDGQFLQEIPHEVVGLPSPTPGAAPIDVIGTAAPLTEGGQVVVTMSEAGFEPASLAVTAGTAVTFVNNGQAAHWPASDVHPTHQALPDFDAKRGLATGESYSYTFIKAGTWQCHDHLMPQSTCTITVSE